MGKKLLIPLLALAALAGAPAAYAQGQLVGLAKSESSFTVNGAKSHPVSTPARAGDSIAAGVRPVTIQTPKGQSIMLGPAARASFGEDGGSIRLNKGDMALSLGASRVPMAAECEGLEFAFTGAEAGAEPTLLLGSRRAGEVVASSANGTFSVAVPGDAGAEPLLLASLATGDEMAFFRNSHTGRWVPRARTLPRSDIHIVLSQDAGGEEFDEGAALEGEEGLVVEDTAPAMDDRDDAYDYDNLPSHRVAYSLGAVGGNRSIEAIATNGEAELISGEAPLATEPRWSPDLNRLLYQRKTGESYDLVIQNVGPGSGEEDFELVTDSAGFDETEPVWGDGKIYFVGHLTDAPASETAIYSMDFEGDPESVTRLTETNLNALSPDQRVLSAAPGHSTDIVFSGYNAETGTRDIFTIEPNGDGLTVLRATPNANETLPRWSPDGKEVAYVTDINGAQNIEIYDVKDGEVVTTAVLANAGTGIDTAMLDFSWSPSGKQFVVTYGSSPGTPNDVVAVLTRQGELASLLQSGAPEGFQGVPLFLAPDWRGGLIVPPFWVVGGSATTIGVVAGGVAAVTVGVIAIDGGGGGGGGGDNPPPPPPPPVSAIAPPDQNGDNPVR